MLPRQATHIVSAIASLMLVLRHAVIAASPEQLLERDVDKA